MVCRTIRLSVYRQSADFVNSFFPTIFPQNPGRLPLFDSRHFPAAASHGQKTPESAEYWGSIPNLIITRIWFRSTVWTRSSRVFPCQMSIASRIPSAVCRIFSGTSARQI